MSIEIGSKWVKDGELVEVENIKYNHFDNNRTSRTDCVWFWDKQGSIHVLTERDFLEQYKPYEEQKQTVVIEKWLLNMKGTKQYAIEEGSKEEMATWGKNKTDAWQKVKLLDTYKVEL